MRKLHTDIKGLMSRAIASGAERRSDDSLTQWKWDTSGTCSRPQYVTIQGLVNAPISFTGTKEERKKISELTDAHPVYSLEMAVPCRKCSDCLNYRAWIWRERAKREIEFAPRTWFSTFTLRPEALYLFKCRATSGRDIETLDDAEQFKLIDREIRAEFTKMLKRMRKKQAHAGGLRYILVTEKHKNGAPHYHMLLHEQSELSPLRKEFLHGQWGYGFSSHKLADKSSAAYVSKYLAKDAIARVRASQKYGSPGIPPKIKGGPHEVGGNSEGITRPKGIERETNVKTCPPQQPQNKN